MGVGGGEEGKRRRWWEEKDKRGEVGGGGVGLLSNLRMMCLEGDAPSSTRDLGSRPEAGGPASGYNACYYG